LLVRSNVQRRHVKRRHFSDSRGREFAFSGIFIETRSSANAEGLCDALISQSAAEVHEKQHSKRMTLKVTQENNALFNRPYIAYYCWFVVPTSLSYYAIYFLLCVIKFNHYHRSSFSLIGFYRARLC